MGCAVLGSCSSHCALSVGGVALLRGGQSCWAFVLSIKATALFSWSVLLQRTFCCLCWRGQWGS